MRKIVIFAMILTVIFAMSGCTDHSEPDKNVVGSSSSNAIIDITQSEKLSEKTDNETVDKSTFAEETTQTTTAETGTEKVPNEPIFSQTTTANTEPKQDTHTQTEPPKSEKSEPEITTNTVSEVTTAVEQSEEFDISYWISYAQKYAQSIHKTQNYKHTVAEPTIRIYAEITDYRMSVPFTRKIVFVKSRQELGKNNIPNLKTKPLNYCLSHCSARFFYLLVLKCLQFFSVYSNRMIRLHISL